MMNELPNILVVCGRNKRRSKTAETLFRKDTRFHTRSAGLSPKSPSQISEHKIDWADAILVMEDGHKARIRKEFRSLDLPPICVLHIEDEFDYMDAELVELLSEKIPAVVEFELLFGTDRNEYEKPPSA